MIDGGLSQTFQQYIPNAHWVRIETGSTGLGIPDLNWCLDGQEGWMELKFTSAYSVALTPEQCGWLLRRHRAGGRVLIAIRRKCLPGPRRQPADELWLASGVFAREIKTYGLKADIPFQVHSGGPRNWDWLAIRDYLVKAH